MCVFLVSFEAGFGNIAVSEISRQETTLGEISERRHRADPLAIGINRGECKKQNRLESMISSWMFSTQNHLGFKPPFLVVVKGVALPAIHSLSDRWFPVQERSRSVAAVTSGHFLGVSERYEVHVSKKQEQGSNMIPLLHRHSSSILVVAAC